MVRFLLLLSLSFLLSNVNAQATISGHVTDENGDALDYAVLYLENTKYSGATERNGQYTIENVSSGSYTLVCTFLGYLTQKQSITVDKKNIEVNFIMNGSLFSLDQIEVNANRLTGANPFAHSTLQREEIKNKNTGQDIPYLLDQTLSAVTTSDAGNGIGYTGLRIRGTDAGSTNITINDVPINDAESQQVYWVDLPDIAASTKDITITRGVGNSTNGAGAFGATLSLNTSGNRVSPYAEAALNYGSFNTKKIGLNLGTGLMNNQYMVDGRYSIIQSDGYIDRAKSDLKSWYFSGARLGKKSSLRFVAFAGHEITYQSWNGSPEALVNGDKEGLMTHYFNNKGSLYKTQDDSINLFNSGRTYNYYTYANQVDDYNQGHYQLHYARAINEKFSIKSIMHFTNGKGFYEESKIQDELSDYGLNPLINDLNDTLYSADIIRKRWLNNKYYGAMVTAAYQDQSLGKLTFGAGYHRYDGDHYGVIKSTTLPKNTYDGYEYYRSNAQKIDQNAFVRYEYNWSNKWDILADLQLRKVDYQTMGKDNDQFDFHINQDFTFFNPKFGINYNATEQSVFYTSFAIGQKEPNRSDFIDHNFLEQPLAEGLQDIEIGHKYKSAKMETQANIYYMQYKNQLVLTGELNDTGSPLRQNVNKSFRMGIELMAKYQINNHWSISPNITLSNNKIKSFDELIYDYTNGFDTIHVMHENTDISFSPSVIGGNNIAFQPIKSLIFSLDSKYVSKQYLDNTQNETRKLDAYSYHNFGVSYDIHAKTFKQLRISAKVNNFTNSQFSSNGYTYSYKYGTLITENFLYPQAGTTFVLSLNLDL